MLEVVERIGINLEYMYAVGARPGDAVMLVFSFEDPAAAVAALQAEGVEVLDRVECLCGDGSQEM